MLVVLSFLRSLILFILCFWLIFSFFVPPEENNACQQVFNQGWSLTVSALNFSNSWKVNLICMLHYMFGSGSSLSSFILFVCSQGVGTAAPAIDYQFQVPAYEYQIKRNNFQKLHPVLNRMFYLKWPDSWSFWVHIFCSCKF